MVQQGQQVGLGESQEEGMCMWVRVSLWACMYDTHTWLCVCACVWVGGWVCVCVRERVQRKTQNSAERVGCQMKKHVRR